MHLPSIHDYMQSTATPESPSLQLTQQQASSGFPSADQHGYEGIEHSTQQHPMRQGMLNTPTSLPYHPLPPNSPLAPLSAPDYEQSRRSPQPSTFHPPEASSFSTRPQNLSPQHSTAPDQLQPPAEASSSTSAPKRPRRRNAAEGFIDKRKWTAEEDAHLISERNKNVPWDQIAISVSRIDERTAARSAASTRLHYQNYVQRQQLTADQQAQVQALAAQGHNHSQIPALVQPEVTSKQVINHLDTQPLTTRQQEQVQSLLQSGLKLAQVSDKVVPEATNKQVTDHLDRIPLTRQQQEQFQLLADQGLNHDFIGWRMKPQATRKQVANFAARSDPGWGQWLQAPQATQADDHQQGPGFSLGELTPKSRKRQLEAESGSAAGPSAKRAEGNQGLAQSTLAAPQQSAATTPLRELLPRPASHAEISAGTGQPASPKGNAKNPSPKRRATRQGDGWPSLSKLWGRESLCGVVNLFGSSG